MASKLTKQQQAAHEANMDAAQKQMDERAAQGENMEGATINENYEIVKPTDVTELKEIKVPTFLERIAAIDEQLAKPDLFDLVRDALQKVKSAEIRKEARTLQAQIRIVRAMMPERVARVPRKPKAA